MADVYRVDGMTCDGCIRSVTRAIQAEYPGSDVKVDLDKGEVSVDRADDRKKVARAIEDAGFSVAAF